MRLKLTSFLIIFALMANCLSVGVAIAHTHQENNTAQLQKIFGDKVTICTDQGQKSVDIEQYAKLLDKVSLSKAAKVFASNDLEKNLGYTHLTFHESKNQSLVAFSFFGENFTDQILNSNSSRAPPLAII